MSGFFIGVIGLLHPKGFFPLIKMLNGSHFYSAESQRPPFKKTEFSRSFFIAKNRDSHPKGFSPLIGFWDIETRKFNKKLNKQPI